MAEVLIFLQRPRTMTEAEMRAWVADRARDHQPRLAVGETDGEHDQQALLRIVVAADSPTAANSQLLDLMMDMRLVGLRPSFGSVVG
jgi:hypothetical protein